MLIRQKFPLFVHKDLYLKKKKKTLFIRTRGLRRVQMCSPQTSSPFLLKRRPRQPSLMGLNPGFTSPCWFIICWFITNQAIFFQVHNGRSHPFWWFLKCLHHHAHLTWTTQQPRALETLTVCLIPPGKAQEANRHLTFTGYYTNMWLFSQQVQNSSWFHMEHSNKIKSMKLPRTPVPSQHPSTQET